MLLENKLALVYGAGGAVGASVARAFAREGARVVLAGRSAPGLEKVATEISEAGGRAEVTIVDALDKTQVENHTAMVADRFGPINIMFNAISWNDTQGTRLVEMHPDRFTDCTDIAIRTWFLTGTAVARHMEANGGGVILGITANAGREPCVMVGGFGVACAAVEHFLRQLAVECGPKGVRVGNVRSAGSPDAPGVQEVFERCASERHITLAEFERQAAADIPLRHLPSLAEVADAVVLMASDHARAMTATTFNVTCGALVD